MSKVKFACEHCTQRLSVDEAKVGMQAKCPRCGERITVPDTEAAAASIDAAKSQREEAGHDTDDSFDDDADPFAEFTVYDDDTELVYEPDYVYSQRPKEVDYDRVSVPRYLLYVQGALLGVVALGTFILGVFFGGATAGPSQRTDTTGPGQLSGELTYVDRAGTRLPESDSVVIVLPRDAEPDQKIEVEGLGPRDEAPPPTHPALLALGSFGGVYVRSDAQGRYTAPVAETGNYHVLILSRHTLRPDGQLPENETIAELGKYLIGPLDLLGQHKYVWRSKRVGQRSTLDYDFGKSRE